MAWFMAKIYDGFMQRTEEACLGRWRAELLAEASGRVLEIGAGTGANLPHYPERVRELVLTEPDADMRRQFERKPPTRLAPRIEADAVGSLSHPDESFDTVVSTLVLCSVDSQTAALRDIRRILKPGGQFLFLEHVAAQTNPGRLKWQRRVEPVWRRIAGNCHVTRDTESAIRAAGFRVEQVKRESIRKVLPWVRPSIRGIARKI